MKRKNIGNWIMGVIVAVGSISLPAFGQNDQSQDKAPTNQQAADNQEQENSDIRIKENPQPGTSDTPGASEAAARANENSTDTTTEVSNAPAVPQTTSSSSGSPAVLADDNGKERDGTNTVQRATMNMVGSPVGNLNLNEGQAVDPDTELADRQDRTQEKEVSAEAHSPNGSTGAESNQINNNSRKENNALSDQNLSSKDKNNQPNAEKTKKDDKRKRKKDKG